MGECVYKLMFILHTVKCHIQFSSQGDYKVDCMRHDVWATQKMLSQEKTLTLKWDTSLRLLLKLMVSGQKRPLISKKRSSNKI